ncbi:MAG: KH domain-containing protein [Pyrinomonadaceae bacterium]
MRETVEMIVKALVDDVEAVDVREVPRAGSTMIEIRVAPSDMGKVIGRQGRTIRALRSLSHAVSTKRNHRFVLEIVETGTG